MAMFIYLRSLVTCSICTYRGADKSLARPTSRCHRTESIVSLEANLQLRSNNICWLQTVKCLWKD